MPTVQSLPLVSDADFSKFNLTSGHITVFNSSYFYILTRSSLTEINTKKPLLAWFNGGPGCSSLDGFFLENGPLRFTPTSINLNDGYWDDFDMLFIDNPPGTGYSTGEFYTSSTQILDGFKEFYRKFSDLYKYDDLYLGGESFAGVWIPFMAQQVTVKGIILGNPWIDPVEQYPSVVEYAKLHGLLTGGYLSRAQEDTQKCLEKISADSSVKTNYDICERITNHVLEESKTTGFCINKYDYTLRDTGPHQQCGMAWPVGIQEMKTYLGRGDVKVAFHSEYKPKIWEECNYRVFDSIIEDLIPPSISIFESLLKTTKIIIFAGDRDIICNYIGLENSLARFGNPTELPWKYGSVKEWGNLSLFVVTNASHMVSYDHPIAAKEVSRSLLGIRIDPGDSAKVSKDTTNDGVVNIQAPSHFIAGLFLLGFFVLAVFGGLYLRKKIVKTSSPPKWKAVPEDEVDIEMVARGDAVLTDSDYDQLIKD